MSSVSISINFFLIRRIKKHDRIKAKKMNLIALAILISTMLYFVVAAYFIPK